MKKIFILTGESSGDKLAAKVINNLKKINPNIDYLSVGGENLKSLGIKSIYDLKEITYLGFTNVILNLFKINKKINQTVKAIADYNPDILFTVDSPDFTLRVAEKIKKINSKIKTIHYVAPQVWVWREGRVKKIKNFIDHILLLFNFEKKYFEKENVSCEFVGHPLLQNKEKSKIDINNGVAISVDLSGQAKNGLIGYRAKPHTAIVDIDRPGSCSVLDYWEPVYKQKNRPANLILNPDEFYILMSKEFVTVPINYAAEIRSKRRHRSFSSCHRW